MDIVSHWLIGWIALGRKNKKQFWLSFAFWILPDLASFGVFSAVTIGMRIRGGWSVEAFDPATHVTPEYVHILYNIFHSVVIWALVFVVLRLIFGKPIKACYARLLHILLDIPTHSLAFFATPFLWPISSYKFDGIPWSNKWIFFPNVAIIIIVYGIWFWKKYKKKKLKKGREIIS
jgi:hypothetical protein